MHLMHTLMRQGCVSGADLEAPVGSIMTRECVSVGEGTHLGDMLELLRTRRINRIPVVDAGMRLWGSCRAHDIINAFE
ncbi:MAG: CBS domain-containing protein [Bilophila wadsworthia]